MLNKEHIVSKANRVLGYLRKLFELSLLIETFAL